MPLPSAHVLVGTILSASSLPFAPGGAPLDVSVRLCVRGVELRTRTVKADVLGEAQWDERLGFWCDPAHDELYAELLSDGFEEQGLLGSMTLPLGRLALCVPEEVQLRVRTAAGRASVRLVLELRPGDGVRELVVEVHERLVADGPRRELEELWAQRAGDPRPDGAATRERWLQSLATRRVRCAALAAAAAGSESREVASSNLDISFSYLLCPLLRAARGRLSARERAEAAPGPGARSSTRRGARRCSPPSPRSRPTSPSASPSSPPAPLGAGAALEAFGGRWWGGGAEGRAGDALRLGAWRAAVDVAVLAAAAFAALGRFPDAALCLEGALQWAPLAGSAGGVSLEAARMHRFLAHMRLALAQRQPALRHLDLARAIYESFMSGRGHDREGLCRGGGGGEPGAGVPAGGLGGRGGGSLVCRERVDAAIGELERLLRLEAETYGAGSEKAAATLELIGSLHAARGRKRKAVEGLRAASEIYGTLGATGTAPGALQRAALAERRVRVLLRGGSLAEDERERRAAARRLAEAERPPPKSAFGRTVPGERPRLEARQAEEAAREGAPGASFGTAGTGRLRAERATESLGGAGRSGRSESAAAAAGRARAAAKLRQEAADPFAAVDDGAGEQSAPPPPPPAEASGAGAPAAPPAPSSRPSKAVKPAGAARPASAPAAKPLPYEAAMAARAAHKAAPASGPQRPASAARAAPAPAKPPPRRASAEGDPFAVGEAAGEQSAPPPPEEAAPPPVRKPDRKAAAAAASVPSAARRLESLSLSGGAAAGEEAPAVRPRGPLQPFEPPPRPPTPAGEYEEDFEVAEAAGEQSAPPPEGGEEEAPAEAEEAAADEGGAGEGALGESMTEGERAWLEHVLADYRRMNEEASNACC
eukprot:tig00021617_g22951.t1